MTPGSRRRETTPWRAGETFETEERTKCYAISGATESAKVPRLARDTPQIREIATCSCPRVFLVCRGDAAAVRGVGSHGLSGRICPVLKRRTKQALPSLLVTRGLCVSLDCQLPLAVLLEERAAQCGAFEDGLYEVILLQGLGQIFIHLSLNALLPVSHHGMCCEGDNRGPMGTHASLVLANLASGLETSLLGVLVQMLSVQLSRGSDVP